MFNATQSTTVRIAQLVIDAATSEEAIALYCELLTVTRDAGNSLRRFSESVALDILHGLFYFITLAVWGMVEAWAYIVAELPRFWQDARSALVEAVATAQGEPAALPWSADGFSADFLANASEELEIVWPEPNPSARWVTGMLPS